MRRALGTALALVLLFAATATADAAGDCTAIAYQASLAGAASALRAVPPDVATAERTLTRWWSAAPPAGAALDRVRQDLAASPPRTSDASQRLEAMSATLAYPAGSTCNQSDTAARAALHDVYAGPAFRQLDSAPAGGVWNDILNALGAALGKAASALGHGGALLVVLVLLALAAVALVRHRSRGVDVRRIVEPEPAELGQDPNAEWRAAEAAAAVAAYREAVRRGFRAALLAVTERGGVFVDSAWTTRELLTRVEADGDVLVALAAAASDFDRAWYSGNRVTAADWAAAAEHCRAVLRTAASLSTAR